MGQLAKPHIMPDKKFETVSISLSCKQAGVGWAGVWLPPGLYILYLSKISKIFLFPFPVGKPVLGQLVDDYLLDFDIFHVSHVTELTHYIDTKENIHNKMASKFKNANLKIIVTFKNL